MKKNSIKHARINQEIVRAMSEILRFELKDPRVDPMTSITEADVATDLKTCKLYVSVLGSEEKCDETIRALRGAEGFLRYQLAQKLDLRNTPCLTFLADRSIAYGMHMSEMIDRLRENGGMDGSENNTEENDQQT